MKTLLILVVLFSLANVTVYAEDGLVEQGDLRIIEEIEGDFFKVDIDETGMFILDLNVDNSVSDEEGFKAFNEAVYNFILADTLLEMPDGVVFRGFATKGPLKDSAVAVYYYDGDSVSQDWSELDIEAEKMYEYTDFLSVAAPFSNYIPDYTFDIEGLDENDPIDYALVGMLGMPRVED